MKQFHATLKTEMTKALKSRMLLVSILFFSFIGMMMGLLVFLSRHPEIAGKSAVMGTKVSMIGEATWPSYLNLLIQMVLTVGSIGCGIVTIWIFGREFSDKVIKDLLVLPVSRYYFVISKYIVVLLWSLILILVMFATGIITGLAIHLEDYSTALIIGNLRVYMVSGILTILLCTIIGLITSMSRSYLLPVAIVILTLIITQFVFIGASGISPYFPWAVPGLFSRVAGAEAPVPGFSGYAILLLTSAFGFAGTIAWWRFSDQK